MNDRGGAAGIRAVQSDDNGGNLGIALGALAGGLVVTRWGINAVG
ncbi:MAG: hypothetical protein AB1586_31845 [Pseudomonadota bacterium]|jgi:hypothetical protein